MRQNSFHKAKASKGIFKWPKQQIPSIDSQPTMTMHQDKLRVDVCTKSLSDNRAALRFTWRLGNKAGLILEAVVSVLKVNMKWGTETVTLGHNYKAVFLH